MAHKARLRRAKRRRTSNEWRAARRWWRALTRALYGKYAPPIITIREDQQFYGRGFREILATMPPDLTLSVSPLDVWNKEKLLNLAIRDFNALEADSAPGV